MIKAILHPIETVKRKIAEMIIKRVVKKIQGMAGDSLKQLASLLENTAEKIRRFAAGDITAEDILREAKDVYGYIAGSVEKLKK